MGREPEAPSGAYHRPLRKRARTTKAIEADQQNRDREGQEDETSEGALSYTRTWKRTMAKGADNMSEAIHKKMKAMKIEFQLEFVKLKNCMAEEVTKSMSQMAQELAQVRE
ncbi:hypothetical protein GGI35DRAFT_472719 [Trichoderma velutinum]